MYCLYCKRDHQLFNDNGILKLKNYDDCVFIRPPRAGSQWITKKLTLVEGQKIYCGMGDHKVSEGNYWNIGHRGYDYGLNWDDSICEACNDAELQSQADNDNEARECGNL